MKKSNYRAVAILLAFIASVFIGFHQFSKKEELKRELNLQGLFMNVKGVEVKTENAIFYDEKPYKSIVIKIPSLASEYDDSVSDSKLVNKIINREQFDEHFVQWLEHTFKKEVASKYTSHIEVWYRDRRVINEQYK